MFLQKFNSICLPLLLTASKWSMWGSKLRMSKVPNASAVSIGRGNGDLWLNAHSCTDVGISVETVGKNLPVPIWPLASMVKYSLIISALSKWFYKNQVLAHSLAPSFGNFLDKDLEIPQSWMLNYFVDTVMFTLRKNPCNFSASNITCVLGYLLWNSCIVLNSAVNNGYLSTSYVAVSPLEVDVVDVSDVDSVSRYAESSGLP